VITGLTRRWYSLLGGSMICVDGGRQPYLGRRAVGTAISVSVSPETYVNLSQSTQSAGSWQTVTREVDTAKTAGSRSVGPRPSQSSRG
jgi:hypothetical protein